jgi:hypothetical protein
MDIARDEIINDPYYYAKKTKVRIPSPGAAMVSPVKELGDDDQRFHEAVNIDDDIVILIIFNKDAA